MSDQYEKGVLKVLRYVYNQMERCRNAENLRKEEDMLAAERIIQDIKERTKEEEKEEKD